MRRTQAHLLSGPTVGFGVGFFFNNVGAISFFWGDKAVEDFESHNPEQDFSQIKTYFKQWILETFESPTQDKSSH